MQSLLSIADEKAGFYTIQIGMNWFPEQPGGMDRTYHRLTQALPTLGIGVRGLVAGSEQVGRDSGGRIIAFAHAEASLMQRFVGVRQAMNRLLIEAQPDLVASHFALYTFPILDRFRHLPFVVHFHGPWADEGAAEGRHGLVQQSKYQLERAVYRRASRFIVHSQAFGHLLAERFQVHPDKIRVVPAAIEARHFSLDISRGEARTCLDWPADRPIVLAVRRLVRRMGLEDLIDAMTEIRRHVPDILLLIAGRGPLAEALAQRVSARGLQDHVRLLGFVPDAMLPQAYRAADLTVVPSVALEGFGLITLESLAAGTPVLVTPVGGLPEAVSGLSPSLVLESSGPGPLAEGIAGALRGNLDLPDEGRCRAYVRDHFDWPVAIKHIRDVYQEVLQ